MQTYSKDDPATEQLLAVSDRYRKRTLTHATRIYGPFTVRTREGELTTEDGWLAWDSGRNPYPIAAAEFDAIYEKAE